MFGAPLWLLGVLAGAAPIIIHLLNRQRFKRVTWAAMDWLLKALERNRRRMRVENLLLLILRVIIVILVALALARPILESGPAAALIGARVCRVFVVDNSYSMGAKGPALTPFERAKRAAADLAATAQGGDVASLIVTGGDSADVIPEPAGDLARTRSQIDAIELSHRDANLPAILAKVAAAVDKMSHPRIRVYVFTDMQRYTWLRDGKISDPALGDALRKAAGKAGMFLVDCSGRDVANTAVAKVVVSADESGEAQGLVAVDVPVTVMATLEHFDNAPRGEIGVRLFVDGRLERQKTVTLDARRPVVASFPGVAFAENGPHVVQVETDADALPLDDKREAAVDVEREVKVLCVNGAPSSDLVSNETYFLERALAPQQFEFAAGLSVFSVDTVGDIDFITRNLNDYRLVVLANVFQVPPEKLAQLDAFVRRGGGLVIFLGDRTETAAWNDLLWAGGNGLLPARILERKSYPADGTESQRFDARGATHEILRTLADRSVDVGLARIREYYYLEAPREDRPDVRVLFRYDNPEASPAAVEKMVGQGRVVLISTSATTRWSTFPLMPTFAPFIQELAGYAVRASTGRRNLLVGEPIRTMLFPGEFGGVVTVVTPGGEKLEHQPAPEGNAFRFDFADTRAAGVYRVDFGGARGRADYCVALDTRESDLERIDKRELDSLLGDNPLVFVAAPEDLREATGRADIGAHIWKTLIYAALVLMLVELLLARIFGSHRGIVKK